jgi:hypothetical protein
MVLYDEGTIAVTAAADAVLSVDSHLNQEGTLTVTAAGSAVLTTETPGGKSSASARASCALAVEIMSATEGTVASTAAASCSLAVERFGQASNETYSLYRGVDGPVDFSSAWETFASLPHTTAALAADTTYRFVLRHTNVYGIETQNLNEWAVVVNAAGAEILAPPSAPAFTRLSYMLAGIAQVEGEYYYRPDGDAQATQWVFWFDATGTDPNPAVDTPTTVENMVKVDGTARFSWVDTAARLDTTDIRVLLRTRRVDADGTETDSTNGLVHGNVVDDTGPDEPSSGEVLGA